MKYLSLKTVAEAFKANSTSTKSKFWGLLSILSSIDSTVEAGVSYDFSTKKVAELLENLFCLEDDKKNFTGESTWNIMLSKKWTEKVHEQMLTKTPYIYNVLIWYFRTTAFDDEISGPDLIKMFLKRIHVSVSDAQKIFDFSTQNITFSNSLYSENDLYKKLGISGKCITAESDPVVAHPGELSRAPFIQTLYAGQSTMECLIIVPFRFSDLYSSPIQKDNKIESSLQKIYYGCPGTGKSHTVQGLTEGEKGEKIIYFDESGAKIDDIDSVEDKSKVTTNIFRTTFHPDYDYSTFVGSYKPVMNPVLDEDGNKTDKEELIYEFVPQVFTNAYVRAYKSLADTSLSDDEKKVYLIIEEINRGNCAQIFGDLFQLLDRKNGKSEFSIIPDAELRKYLSKEGLESNKLELPANLHILATMNTSDQSLFPMDSAFKRRWEMEYVPINLKQE
ncbi:MAG: AAA family ATPase, partial [Bacteroidales bacterium]|nr:AAA family ATPase [Bacteroidales bacterium]